MIDLATASDYVRLFRGRHFVIKVGGACLARPGLVRELGRQIAVIDACGAHPIVVHGAGPQVDLVQRRLGEEPRKVAGRRITTPLALDALSQVTRGEIGPALAAEIERHGARAALLKAESCVSADKRPPVAMDGERVDFGLVGDIRRVDPQLILATCAEGSVPILSPPVADAANPGEEAGRLNANADLLAAQVAIAVKADKLVLCTSAGGVLTDPREPRSALSTLSLAELDALEAKGGIQDGMRVKARATRDALEGDVPRVHVVSGIEPEALLGELYTTHGTGTLITREPESAHVGGV